MGLGGGAAFFRQYFNILSNSNRRQTARIPSSFLQKSSMSTYKRRIVDKDTGRQSQLPSKGAKSLPFSSSEITGQQRGATKSVRPSQQQPSGLPQMSSQDSRSTLNGDSQNYQMYLKEHISALETPASYRSTQKRLKQLLPGQESVELQRKMIKAVGPATFGKYTEDGNLASKPSTVTTQFTSRAVEMSGTKSGTSTCFGSSVKKRKSTDIFNSQATDINTATERKRGKRTGNDSLLVGQKRLPDAPIQRHEYFSRIRSSAAKDLVSKIMLRNKKTGEIQQFNCVNESDFKKIFSHAIITEFKMEKLEVEYDYDTDTEQITHSKKMLFRELAQAIEFFVQDDPLKLVGNVQPFKVEQKTETKTEVKK